MARHFITFILVLVLASPLAGGHAFGHAEGETDVTAALSHNHATSHKCERSCDDENSRPYCTDALMHCVTIGIEMNFHGVAFPIALTEAWNAGFQEVFRGLSSEAETPPPRI